MDRDDTHEQRIKEVKEALAALHELQAELARRDMSTGIAVLHSPSTEVVVDERHGSSRGSGLGSGVVALLILTAAAAGLVSAGQTDVATWAHRQWAEGVRRISNANVPAVASIADHLPSIDALKSGGDRSATPRDEGPTRHTSVEADALPAAKEPPGQPERTASLPHETPVENDGAATGPPTELGDDSPRHSQPRQDVPPANQRPAPQQRIPAVPARIAPTIPPADARVVVLREARQLLEANEIEAARRKLRSHSPDQHADIAWALARTYDPRHIRSVGADASAGDIEEAEKWYRRWYTIGVESGLVSRNFRIDRLIEAMRRQ